MVKIVGLTSLYNRGCELAKGSVKYLSESNIGTKVNKYVDKGHDEAAEILKNNPKLAEFIKNMKTKYASVKEEIVNIKSDPEYQSAYSRAKTAVKEVTTPIADAGKPVLAKVSNGVSEFVAAHPKLQNMITSVSDGITGFVKS